MNARHNNRIIYFRICRTCIPCVVFPRNLRQQDYYNHIKDTGEAHCLSLRSCPCCVSLTPWPHSYCCLIKFPLMHIHLHTSPIVLVAHCRSSSNATTSSNYQIHRRLPDYVRSTCARNSYPTCSRRLPSGTPSPVLRCKTSY